MKKIVLIIISICCEFVFAAGGRITGPSDAAIRCRNNALDTASCEDRRQRALATNCITQEEYRALYEYGSYPICDMYAGEGLDKLSGWCACGCFDPGTNISAVINFTGKNVEASAYEIAHNKGEFSLVHMTPSSTLSNIGIGVSLIRVSTSGAETKKLISIQTEDGRKLNITEKHPVLLANGKMVQARHVKKSDFLVDMYGSKVKIKSITKTKATGDVVNFATEASNDKEHIIFAEGLSVGDLFWQSSLEHKLNRITLRQ